MKKWTILFDADDTTENFCDCWVETLNERYGTSVRADEIKDWDITHAFSTLTRDQIFQVIQEDAFWYRISPVPGAVDVLQRLKDEGHELYMVTASDYRTCSAKFTRILELFKFLDWEHIIVTSRKQMVKGDILIDDAPQNLVGGDYFKILFDRPHNRWINAHAADMLRLRTWEEIDYAIHYYIEKAHIRGSFYGCNQTRWTGSYFREKQNHECY